MPESAALVFFLSGVSIAIAITGANYDFLCFFTGRFASGLLRCFA